MRQLKAFQDLIWSQWRLFLVLSCSFGGNSYAQDNYSFDSVNSQNENGNQGENNAGSNMFNEDPGNASLFEDEPTNIPVDNVVPLAPEPKLAPKPAATVQSKPKSPSVPANQGPKTAPIPTQQPSNILSPEPLTESAETIPASPQIMPATPAMPAPVTPTPVAVYQPPAQAPLKTDGSVAPIKNSDLPSPNEFAGVPALPGSRRNLSRGQAPEFYVIEEGDTMFDVCSQFIDDGNYWPKLWALNPDIKNPHFVFPGMKLAFFPGDPLMPPRLEVVEEDDMVPVDKGAVKEAELVADVVMDLNSLPKSGANISSAVREMAEIVGPESIDVNTVADQFEDAGLIFKDNGVVVQIPAFIEQNEIEPLGVVRNGVSGEVLGGVGVEIVIEDAERLDSNQVYTVLRAKSTVYDPQTEDKIGYRYDFVGNIKVLNKIDDEEFKGVVVENRVGVIAGDLVVPFRSTKRNVGYASEPSGPVGQAKGTVTGFEFDGKNFGGSGSLVFINSGKLSPGSYIGVFKKSLQDLTIVSDKSTEKEVPSQIGVIKIIDSNELNSIGIVVSSKREIKIGDPTYR